MEILNYIISPGKEDYECYSMLKELFSTNKHFRDVIISGIQEGAIRPFSEELWDKLDRQNIRAQGVNSFLDVFKDGANLGYCTVAAKQVSYSLPRCFICGGIVEPLIGTINSPDGSHTWIEVGDEIIDTSLVLVFDKTYASKLGYHEENRYDPNLDPVYLAAKEFTNDVSLKRP